MGDCNSLRKYQLSKAELTALISEAEEPDVNQQETDRIIKILDTFVSSCVTCKTSKS